MNLYNTKERTFRILKEHPEARNSDEVLISMVDTDINPTVAKMPYWVVMHNRAKYGLPTCESIRRCRQKLQSEHPELGSHEKIARVKREREKEYREFVRSKA